MMAKVKGLGRGLDALLAGDSSSANSSEGLLTLPVGQLQPGKYQPRTHMDQASLESLASSIREQGIMQPIIVREIVANRYEIIAGERRWRASQLAGLAEVPVIVREIPDEAALAMALIENIQRENLNPIEEANGIKRLIDEFAMTHELAAKAVGRSRSAVTNLLRLQQLHPAVQEMLMQAKLDMGHARALLALEGAKQITTAEQIVQGQLSVRAAEQLVKRNAAATSAKASKPSADRDILRLQESLSEALGASVTIEAGKNGAGALKIRYASLDQLDSIIKKLS
jgi:ParB family chromosome partitioning protein